MVGRVREERGGGACEGKNGWWVVGRVREERGGGACEERKGWWVVLCVVGGEVCN